MNIEKHILTHVPKEYFPYRHVIYVECRYIERINSDIQAKESIESIFEEKGLKFVYLPTEVARLLEKPINKNPKFIWDLNSELLNYIEDEAPDEIGPSLFFSLEKEWKGDKAVIYSIPFDLNESIEQVPDMADVIAERFLYEDSLSYDESFRFLKAMPSQDQSRLEKAIQKAFQNGSNDTEIRKIVEKLLKRYKKISHVTITKDYRIILDDLDNGTEVKMKDLPKALYLFFMKHEEGIDRNDLYKYLPELVFIYISVKSRWVAGERELTLERIDHLIGEQFANNLKDIRNAFQKAADDRKAYCVNFNGDSDGKIYLIEIPSEKRVWQCPNILHNHIPTVDNVKGLREKVRQILNDNLPQELQQYY